MSVIFLGRDNVLRLQLLKDRQPVTPGAVTRVIFVLPAVASDAGEEEVFDTQSTPTEAVLAENGTVVEIRAGGRALKPRWTSYLAHITVYDSAHPDGLAWGDPVRVKVKTWPPGETP